MNSPTIPFHLHARASETDSPVPPDENLPAEVAGQPAAYFWKEMIHTGNYVHPSRGFSLAVDFSRLQRWADVGAQMLAAGVAIPINCDHSDRARDVVGYVKEFKLQGERLLALCQFIGDDAALMAARNLVSVGIDPNFTDGHARNWGEAIVHLALTPVPVVQNQGHFMEAARTQAHLPAEDDLLLLAVEQSPAGQSSSDDSAMLIPCSADQWDALGELLPGDLSELSAIDRIISRLQEAAAADIQNHEGDDEEDDSDLRAQLATARRRLLELSTRLPPALSDEAEAALVESATAKFDFAVSRGGISPAVRDKLVASLIRDDRGRTNVLALSRVGNSLGERGLAMAVAEILLENRAIVPGELSGLQTMSRTVPGEEVSPVHELRQYMTRIASVSG